MKAKAAGLLPGEVPEEEEEEEEAAPGAGTSAKPAEVKSKDKADDANAAGAEGAQGHANEDDEPALRYQFCHYKISDLTELLTKLDRNRKMSYIRKLDEMVTAIVSHPVKPKSLLRGDTIAKVAMSEFVGDG